MKKKQTRTKRPAPVIEAERPYTFSEAVDFVLTIPEIRESFTRADVELAIDDRGWTNYSNSGTRSFVDISPSDRNLFISRSRIYWMRDPLAKQAVRLWTDYALGEGFSYKMADGDTGYDDDAPEGSPNKPAKSKEADPIATGNADSSATMATLDKFMKHRKNKKIMNSEGQRKSSKKVLLDGDVFFAMFDDEVAGKIIRRVDPLQITDIICDPDDDDTVLAYRRVTSSDKVLYYKDWALEDDDADKLAAAKDPNTGKTFKAEDNVVMYHAAFDSLSKRGNGLLFCVSDWSREHRKMMEARVAIIAALAKFSWKGQVEGGQMAVNQLKKQLESSYVQTGPSMPERNPVNAPAATMITNKGVQLEPTARATGAGDAQGDSNMLKLMVSAGTGVMLHYFGDPSTGNLATATAMELPMLKMFASYQKFWRDVYRDIFSIVLDEDPDEEPAEIDIDFPPILEQDVQKMSQFLTSVVAAFPEAKIPDVLRIMLEMFGLNNLDELMEQIADNKDELDAKQQEEDQFQRKLQTAGLAGSNGKPPVVTKEALEAQQELARAFLALAEKLG